MKTSTMVIVLLSFVITLLVNCSPDEGSESPKTGFTPINVTLKEAGDLKELVDEKLVFVDSMGVEWVAPKGTLTDGASVPRLALWLSDGRFESEFLKAAIIHDAYCQSENEERTPNQFKKRSWQNVHRMFYEACLAGGTSPLKARIMFAAVWLGGPRWDAQERSLDHVSEEKLKAEFDYCKKWISTTNPSVAEIEAWMTDREQALLAAPN